MKKFVASVLFSSVFAVGCGGSDPASVSGSGDTGGSGSGSASGSGSGSGTGTASGSGSGSGTASGSGSGSGSGSSSDGGTPANDGGPAPSDGGAPMDLPPPDHAPTVHAPQPTFTTQTSGVMTAPKVYTIVWQGDEAEGTKIDDFTKFMFGDKYWTSWGTEYGIGAGTSGGVIVIPSAPPTSFSDTQAQALIKKSLGTAGWPASADINSLFGFVLNPNTKSTQGGGASGCVDYDGYHSATQAGYPYYIAVRCKDSTGADSFDELTITISHEIAEAASDPYGDMNIVQGIPGGGEIGDICLVEDIPITAPSGTTYQLQRLYSNKAAKAGTSNPCVPDDGTFYFGASLVTTSAGPQQITINTDSTGAGSATFNVETFSYGTGSALTTPIAWAFDAGDFLPAGMTFSPNVGRGQDASGNVVGSKLYGYPGTTFPVTVSVDSTVQTGSYITLLFSTTPTTSVATAPGFAYTSRINSFWVVINVQ